MGDSLLGLVAARLQKMVRASDTVSRLGGDEFVIIFGSLADPHEATAMLKRLLRSAGRALSARRATSHRFRLGRRHPLPRRRRRAGHSHPPRRPRHVRGQEGRAQSASMSTIPSTKGRRKPQRVAPHHRRRNRRQRVPALLPAQVDMRAGKVIGAEALIRWQHPSAACSTRTSSCRSSNTSASTSSSAAGCSTPPSPRPRRGRTQGWRCPSTSTSRSTNCNTRTSSRTSQPSSSACRGSPLQHRLRNRRDRRAQESGEIAARLKECRALGFRFAVTTSAPAIRRSPTSSRYPSTPSRSTRSLSATCWTTPKTLPSSKA